MADKPTLLRLVMKVLEEQRFLLGVVAAVLIALAYPKGASFVAPDITAKWVAVVFIFFMSGMGLKTAELSKAVKRIHFNTAVQAYNLCFLTLGVFGVSRVAKSLGMNELLADGMVICAALPMTVNMVIVMTVGSDGDEAAAIFNSAFGNFIGIFITPMWVLTLLGKDSNIAFLDVVLKLVYKVLAPLAAGQFAQFYLPSVKAFATKHKKRLKMAQEVCLVFIVYTVFCATFEAGTEASAEDVATMAGVQSELADSGQVRGVGVPRAAVSKRTKTPSHGALWMRAKNGGCRDPSFAGHVRWRRPTRHVQPASSRVAPFSTRAWKFDGAAS